MIGKIYFTACLLFLYPLLSYGADFTGLLEKADALVNFSDSDFSAEYTIVQYRPGEGQTTTVSAVFRRDSEQKYVIIILKPEISKGQGYLKMENTLWFYDPESRCFNSTSSKERFQNTNAR
ncbi:MAG: outer membrane lipoprotein-sorting protein, partial [Spirochaetales bacterium]|nr:outer membrane lipoprotein-sorting protein [Spirochaetales bacterium]